MRQAGLKSTGQTRNVAREDRAHDKRHVDSGRALDEFDMSAPPLTKIGG